MLKDERGDICAGDATDLPAGLRRDDLDGVGRRAVGEAGGTDDGPVETAGAELGFHAFLVRDGAAKEDGHESAIERRDIGDAVANAERGDGDEAADVVKAHGGDEVARDVRLEGGFEERFACADGVDDCVLGGDGGGEELRIARVALKDAGAVQGSLGG